MKAEARSLEWALGCGLVLCRSKDPSRRPANPPPEASSALLYLAVAAHEGVGGETVSGRVAESLHTLVAGGVEPSMNAGPFWGYALLSGAIALARRTPSVWDRLSPGDRGRLDVLVECFAVLASIVTDDANDYRTGPLRDGNFHKEWNPNHRMAMVFPAVFAALYFGPAELDARLCVFDFDSAMERLRGYGFTNIVACWGSDPGNRALLMEGGVARFRYDVGSTDEKAGSEAGRGTGVRHPYRYHGHGLGDLAAIVRDLYDFNYIGGPVFSDSSAMAHGLYLAEEVAARSLDPALVGTPKAYIADHTVSPWQGRDGMMREFNSFDVRGIRSSASYCAVDFVLVVATLVALRTLGAYDATRDEELFRRIIVGNEDCLYKLGHGYESFSIGVSHGIVSGAGDSNLRAWASEWEKVLALRERALVANPCSFPTLPVGQSTVK